VFAWDILKRIGKSGKCLNYQRVVNSDHPLCLNMVGDDDEDRLSFKCDTKNESKVDCDKPQCKSSETITSSEFESEDRPSFKSDIKCDRTSDFDEPQCEEFEAIASFDF